MYVQAVGRPSVEREERPSRDVGALLVLVFIGTSVLLLFCWLTENTNMQVGPLQDDH